MLNLGYVNNPDKVNFLARHALETFFWTQKELGVSWWEDRVEYDIGHSVRRCALVKTNSGTGLIFPLYERARTLGVELRVHSPVVGLLTDDEGAVTGVECQTPSGRKTFRARSVVLATGGFGASAPLRMRWAPIFDETYYTTYAAGSSHLDPATGDGIRMAEAVGAALRDMDAVMAIPFWGGRVLDYPGAEIFLTLGGRRFTDETGTWQSVLDDLSRLGEKEFWVVTDARSRKGATFATKVQQGTVRTAQDLSELALRMGIPANALRAEMEKYNRAADLGRDEEFGRTRFTQRIETPPFYFGRERFDIHYTCGGVAITAKAEVKNADDRPIAGLYAAGEVTGGVHGNFRLGGNGLTDAFVFGRVAGRSAALRAQTLRGEP